MEVNFVRLFQARFFARNPAIEPMVNIMAQVPERQKIESQSHNSKVKSVN
jgi:hypothetical protein